MHTRRCTTAALRLAFASRCKPRSASPKWRHKFLYGLRGARVRMRCCRVAQHTSHARAFHACARTRHVQELLERKKTLEAQILALRNKIEIIERRQVERRALDDKRRQEELAYLKHQAKHLDMFLKSMPKM
ncbi:hypothetical protein EON68_00400 [archaeon]|nr:MAG: hypothetical protein EON68_00400 [archaeon]